MNLFDFAAQEARKYGLDPDLVLRQMRSESGGNPAAVSPKGARGPMQLMPGTARQLGVDIDDPLDNIRGGVRYLAQQQREFGSPELALAAYNAGPGNVRKYGGVPPFSETQNYVGKIMGGRSTYPQDDSDIFGAPAQVGRASARLSGAAVGLKPDLQGFGNPADPWLLTAYEKPKGSGSAPGAFLADSSFGAPGTTMDTAGFRSGGDTARPADTSSIDDILAQMLSESAAARAPAETRRWPSRACSPTCTRAPSRPARTSSR